MYLILCTVFTLLSLASADSWCCKQPANFDAKIDVILVHSDLNNDSLVSLREIQRDMDQNYDKNHDNRTSKVEFVLARQCLFGDTVGYGEFVFRGVDMDKDGYFTIADVSRGPLGKAPMTTAQYEARVRARYQRYIADKIIG